MNSLTIAFPGIPVPMEPVINLCKALAENTSIRNFKLSGYSNVNLAAWFSYVIQHNHGLEFLDLGKLDFNYHDISCILRALNSNTTLRGLELVSAKDCVSLSVSAIKAIEDNFSLTHLKIGSRIYELGGQGGVVDIERSLYRNKWLKIYSDHRLLVAILLQNEIYFPSELIRIILSKSLGSEVPRMFFANQLIKTLENIKKPIPSLIAKPLIQRLNHQGLVKSLTINRETDLNFCLNYLRTNQLMGLCLNINYPEWIPSKRLEDLMESLLGLGKNLEVLILKISKLRPNSTKFDSIFATKFIEGVNNHLISLKSFKCIGLADAGVQKLLLQLVAHSSLEELNLEIQELFSESN